MARATQNQSGPRWNPYSNGEMRKLLKDELDKLSNNDTYRNSKVGTGSFKDAKGRTNWNIYLYGELFEKLAKRFDDTMRGTYTNTFQTLNAQNTALNNLQQQLRTLENNVNKYLKQNFDNVLTNVVRNSTQFEQFKTEYAKSASELSKLSEANKTDIRKATKILKDNFITELSTLKKDLSIDQEELKEKVVGMEDKVKVGLSNFEAKSSEIVETIKTTLDESNDNLEGKLELISEKANKLTTEVSQIENDLTEFIEDKMGKQRDILNNVLDDQQKITVSDITEKISQQTNISKENFETQAEKLAVRVGDIHASMDERMNAISETVNSKLQEFQENYDNTFTKEMGELKTQLSSIRADIEIMKTLLANIAR